MGSDLKIGFVHVFDGLTTFHLGGFLGSVCVS